MAFNPMLMAAMSAAKPQDAGLASGLVNTSFMMGGALGLAVLTSLAAARHATRLAAGATESAALLSGYHVAFFVGAACAATAALVGLLVLRHTPLEARLEPVAEIAPAH
jgi:sugar phosphate permease